MADSVDREFFRVDGQVYLYVEPLSNPKLAKDAREVHVPTFSLPEDDIVGLSIDAFREELMQSDLPRDQREYFLKIQQLISMTKRYFDAEKSGQAHKIFKKTLVNISGSGIAFSCVEPMALGQLVLLAIYFPRFPYRYVSVQAKVLKCERATDGYMLRCEYDNISEATQDEILRFVNQCQRDSRVR